MIIIDFDGTLVDVWERYYKVFIAVTDLGALSFSKYKQLKKELEIDTLIAQTLGVIWDDKSTMMKRELLEDIDLLHCDKPIINKSNLEWLIHNNGAQILTIRRNPKNLYREIDCLGWNALVPKIHVLTDTDRFSKYNYVKNQKHQEMIYCIGDSETDFNVGNLENSIVYAVGTGLRKTTELEGKRQVVADVNEALHIIRSSL